MCFSALLHTSAGNERASMADSKVLVQHQFTYCVVSSLEALGDSFSVGQVPTTPSAMSRAWKLRRGKTGASFLLPRCSLCELGCSLCTCALGHGKHRLLAETLGMQQLWSSLRPSLCILIHVYDMGRHYEILKALVDNNVPGAPCLKSCMGMDKKELLFYEHPFLKTPQTPKPQVLLMLILIILHTEGLDVKQVGLQGRIWSGSSC